MSERVSGGDALFKAPFFLDCFVGECRTERPDGTTPRSQMQLQIIRLDGTLLQRPFNDGPTYKCERVGCYFHEYPRPLHEINSKWIRDAGHWEHKREEGEDRTTAELEKTL